MLDFALVIAVANMLLVQLLKLPIQYFIDKRWSPWIVFSTGGMPSSHSALVTSLTLAIALTEGIDTPYFALSLVFASVVVHDSIGLRREAGKHATIINQMKQEVNVIISELQSGPDKNPDKLEQQLKELLGHEPLEAIIGVLIGVVTTLLSFFIWIA